MPLGKVVGLGPGHIVLDGDPVPTAAPPHFRSMPIVAKRSPISATAELLFCSCYVLAQLKLWLRCHILTSSCSDTFQFSSIRKTLRPYIVFCHQLMLLIRPRALSSLRNLSSLHKARHTHLADHGLPIRSRSR